jgi:hypothetical protein
MSRICRPRRALLRVPDQSAAVTTTISDLASLTELASLAGSVAVCHAGCCVLAIPDQERSLSPGP